ncbi:MAG: HTTM domain-containing protein, partial [Myxococcota bacterium]
MTDTAQPAGPAAQTGPSPGARVLRALWAPRDIASLAVFRILFGGLMMVSALRFLLSDWIPQLYGEPTFFFKHWGLAWIPVPPQWALVAIYIALTVLAGLVALGLLYRLSIVLFTALFTYTQLLDVTNYLNHYYLVVLLGLLMCFMPLHRGWSLDAWRKPALASATLPAWCLYLLRFQVAVVYCFAGLAKLNSDWLLHAQPLGIWLSARTEFPLIGVYFDELWLAYTMSWAGFLFDSSIVVWLSLRRTRPWAYAVVIGFHLLTSLLFNIGMFPYIMIVAATLLFDPSWPRRLVRPTRHVTEQDSASGAASPDLEYRDQTRAQPARPHLGPGR